MKVYIETYGCTANEADSSAMREAIVASGGAIADSPADADAVIVNTCAVTEHTSRAMLRAIRRHAGRRVIVAGCMAATQADMLQGCEHAAAPGAGPALVLLGLACGDGIPLTMSCRTAIVRIAEGCRGQCSYCIVRRARGDLKSRPPGEIVAAVRRAVQAGATEILLTAQDTGAYGLDIGERLPDLLRGVNDVPGDFKVRVGMMNPFSVADIVPELIDALRLPRIYRFAHIPVQSGSDRILRLMNRPYTAREYRGLIGRMREGIPDITFSTDYIAGFPTESDEDFALTMENLRHCRPLKVNITRFSPRPGTPAASMTEVPGPVKRERSRALTVLHHEITSAYMRAAVGSVRRVLVTENGKPGTVVARDESYNMVVIPESLPPGAFTSVEITGSGITYMIGKRQDHNTAL
ncbi:MAG: (Dimethylallyl)adenosine tRNA methylthiotransferase MiaB [Methanocella sp. PtaU1.Bin125]|nr:MAG: (Dimethylallyl)adenosine tRNA methylthiotransferase MiaB [Methanocella sp. PtaU1.Bin125]